MAFLKGRLYRKSSERSRATSVDDTTATKHRKSESTSSRSASVPDAEKQESINIEVEQLFQQATDTDNDLTAGRHGHSKKEPSLFLKFMKRKVSPASSTGLREGISRSFSHLGRRSPSTEAKSDEGRVQSSSPDFASETGYDSDALFIPSPRFSELSSDSVHPCSPVHMERTMTSLNHVLANDLRSQPNSNEENEPIAPPSTERPRLNDLSISKRRKKIEHPMEKSSHSYSQRTASNVAKKESERTETTAGVIENIRKRSRFTEMFHLGMKDDVSLQQSRRVSIGWMSEGKRCGYGYSFVDKEKAVSTSSLTEAPADDSSETEEWQSTRDVVINDDSQHADDDSQSNVETFSRAEDEESVPEREITLSPYQRLRWTIFPSHTKSERNLPMDLDDGVIVRDFCFKASPDRPQQDSGEEKKRHLISNAIRQGFHDTFLWVIGLGKREIARYHAGLEVHAARSHDCVDPTFETTVPYWDNAPKEELGDYHIEAWRAAKQRQKKRDGGNLGKFKVSVTHAVDVAAKKARKKSTSSSSSSSSPKDVRETPLSGLGSGTRYVGRRHSAKF